MRKLCKSKGSACLPAPNLNTPKSVFLQFWYMGKYVISGVGLRNIERAITKIQLTNEMETRAKRWLARKCLSLALSPNPTRPNVRFSRCGHSSLLRTIRLGVSTAKDRIIDMGVVKMIFLAAYPN